MSDFSLIDLIRRVIDETDLSAPAEVADKVLEMIPVKNIKAALAEALPYLVQTEMGRQRMARPTAPRRAANPSSKVAAIRGYADAWRARLRDRISVGRNEWKLLVDCSAIDFRHAAESRRALAAGALANAVEFESFAAALDTHEAARFGDLPEAEQRKLLGGEEQAA